MPAENGAKLQITVVTEQDVNLLVTIMMHLTTQKSGEDSGRKCPCADALVITVPVLMPLSSQQEPRTTRD